MTDVLPRWIQFSHCPVKIHLSNEPLASVALTAWFIGTMIQALGWMIIMQGHSLDGRHAPSVHYNDSAAIPKWLSPVLLCDRIDRYGYR